MIVEPVPPGTKVPCPVCSKDMIPKAGPGARDMDFPDKPMRDTVFDLDVPEQVRRAMEENEKRKRERESKK